MQFKFMDNEITWEEYEDWKANWPDSLSEDYVFDSSNSSETTYEEYIEKVQKLDDDLARKESLAEKRFNKAKKKSDKENKE